MAAKFVLLAALAACDQLDTAETFVTDHGTVYVCPEEPAEWCWNGTRAKLEALVGESCHAIDVTERAWPALVGCSYCCGDGCPRGCNAHLGCACEAAP